MSMPEKKAEMCVVKGFKGITLARVNTASTPMDAFIITRLPNNVLDGRYIILNFSKIMSQLPVGTLPWWCGG